MLQSAKDAGHYRLRSPASNSNRESAAAELVKFVKTVTGFPASVTGFHRLLTGFLEASFLVNSAPHFSQTTGVHLVQHNACTKGTTASHWGHFGTVTVICTPPLV